jgi:hypothetical protein
MKKNTIFLFLFCFLVTVASAQSNTSTTNQTQTTLPYARVTCAKTTHDFGKIPFGTPVTFSFGFKNEGKKPLVINDVSTPCGCTTPMFDKEKAFETGTTAPIEITYNAATEGTFQKTVTVTYNETSTMELTIKGEVLTNLATPTVVVPAIEKHNTHDGDDHTKPE